MHVPRRGIAGLVASRSRCQPTEPSGSLNFDPRSEKHNTELGLLIRSPLLTGRLLELAELVKTEAAYRVRLNRDTRRTEWSFTGKDGPQTLTEEPDTNFLQRWLLWLVSPFVPEDHL